MLYKTATLYDSIYTTKNYSDESERLHTFIQAHKSSPGKTLLDVACGTGEHILHLSKYYDVEGLDINPEFLEIVKRKLPKSRVHLMDMETFKLDVEYDAITCLFSSIGYTRSMDKLKATLSNMKNHLQPGGVLIIEPWYTPTTFKPGHYTGTVQEIEGGKVARMNHWALENGCSVGDSQFLIASTTGIQHITEVHQLGLFSNEQYSEALASAGLKPHYDEHGLIGRGLFIGAN